MQTGSTVGSVQGNVDISSNQDITIQASDILAGQDINLSGQSVNILDATERYKNTESHEFKQTGLTVSLSVAVAVQVSKPVPA